MSTSVSIPVSRARACRRKATCGIAALGLCLIFAPHPVHASEPFVAGATTPTGQGGWSVQANGAVGAFKKSSDGDAHVYGDARGLRLAQPITGMAATPTGKGYWLVAGDGGVFSYGDARFSGSMGGRHLNAPIVGMARTPSGNGYWIAGKSIAHICRHGGCGDLPEPVVYQFGDAKNLQLALPIGDVPSVVGADAVAIIADPVVRNYLVLGSEGHFANTCAHNGGCF